MDSLSSLGLSDLETLYTLSNKASNDSPILSIGDIGNLTADQLSRTLHIQPLMDGNKPRYVASGYLVDGASGPLEAARVYYAGPDPLTAQRIAILERSTLALQTALAVEAVKLGIASGISQNILYSAIAGAAGSSWSFKHLAPCMLGLEKNTVQSISEARNALSAIIAMTNSRPLPLPLAALSKQLYLASRSPSEEAWTLFGEVSKAAPAAINGYHLPPAVKPSRVAFVGLGAMGYGMANVLRNENIDVMGYDAWEPSMTRYVAAGGVCAATAEACATEANVFILMVVNAAQAEAVLIDQNAILALPLNAVILLMCTVGPAQVLHLVDKVRSTRPDLYLVDAPVSGGTPRAASGDLTILCAGLEDAGPHAGEARYVVETLSGRLGNKDNMIVVPGGPSKGAAVKLVNQHLAGCHIISVAEALATASSLKAPLDVVRDIIMTGPASSWMMGHRGQNMIRRLIQPPTSTIEIFVKDMGIVTSEAAAFGLGVPLAAQVEQLFVMGRMRGWGHDDDSSIVRLWGENIMATGHIG